MMHANKTMEKTVIDRFCPPALAIATAKESKTAHFSHLMQD
jgi:hypothetical protein